MQSLLTDEKKSAPSKNTTTIPSTPSFDVNSIVKKEEIKATFEDYNKTMDTIRPETNKRINPCKFKITEINRPSPISKETLDIQADISVPKSSKDNITKDDQNREGDKSKESKKEGKCIKESKVEAENISNIELLESDQVESEEEEVRNKHITQKRASACLPSLKCLRRKEKEPLITDPNLRYLLEMEKLKQS